ncbi:hypothetical protein GCM10008916_25730 [Clostridium nitritogenes]|uniref:Uncharacterized protein n=1 Tax=Clostridium nitritogenes TaxID=83340 RepID=A0ABP3X3G4_9CLOT
MSFKRILGILEGNHAVKVTGVKLLNYEDERQALNLTVRTIEGGVYGNFLIFTNNVYLIDKLIDITYDDQPNDEVNEEDFFGIYMEITTKEKNGYMNIVDINPVEVEEEEEESEFEESEDIEL